MPKIISGLTRTILHTKDRFWMTWWFNMVLYKSFMIARFVFVGLYVPVYFIKWHKHETFYHCNFVKNIWNFGETPISRLRMYILQTRTVSLAHFFLKWKKASYNYIFIVSRISVINENIRSRHPQVFIWKGFLEIFIKFTRECPC